MRIDRYILNKYTTKKHTDSLMNTFRNNLDIKIKTMYVKSSNRHGSIKEARTQVNTFDLDECIDFFSKADKRGITSKARSNNHKFMLQLKQELEKERQ